MAQTLLQTKDAEAKPKNHVGLRLVEQESYCRLGTLHWRPAKLSILADVARQRPWPSGQELAFRDAAAA